MQIPQSLVLIFAAFTFAAATPTRVVDLTPRCSIASSELR